MRQKFFCNFANYNKIKTNRYIKDMNFVEELKWRGMLHDMMPGTEEWASTLPPTLCTSATFAA
jgi:hypothetical protein